MSQPEFTVPASVTQWSMEDRTWPQDMAGGLGGLAPTNVTAQLFNNLVTAVPLTDGPNVATGSTVNNQRVRAGVLISTLSPYLLVTTYTPTGSTDVLAVATRINCPR